MNIKLCVGIMLSCVGAYSYGMNASNPMIGLKKTVGKKTIKRVRKQTHFKVIQNMVWEVSTDGSRRRVVCRPGVITARVSRRHH